MCRISASEKSDLTLLAALFFLLLLYIVYNAVIGQETQELPEVTEAVMAGENPGVTIAAI